MNKKFETGDAVYFSSQTLGCSCIVKITSTDKHTDLWDVEHIYYNRGTSGFGTGCNLVNIHSDCLHNVLKIDKLHVEFLKLFTEWKEEDYDKKEKI